MKKRRITTDGVVFRVEEFQEYYDWVGFLLGKTGYWATMEMSHNHWAFFDTRGGAEAFLDRENTRHPWTVV